MGARVGVTAQAEQNRTVLVVYRTTPAERERLAAAAKARELSVSAFLRAAVEVAVEGTEER